MYETDDHVTPLAVPRARAWLLLVNTILVALLAGGALFAVVGRGPAWGWAHPAPGDVTGAPAIRPDLSGVTGVNLDASEVASADLGERLAELETMGVRWVRFRLPWNEIELERGQFHWEAWDRVFTALRQHPALEPVVVLNGAPAWARPAGDAQNAFAPPQTRADFGAFAQAVARRYGGQVRYYQLWDEPNIAPHWGARPVDAGSYVGLLREGAAQVRAADSDSQIVLAALAPNLEAAGANQSDLAYLDAIYNAGGRAWFDIVAAEPFGFSRPPEDRPDVGRLNFGRAALLRDVMVRHGDVRTPIWATAFGWNALPADWAGADSPWGQVSETDQARFAAGAAGLARTQWPWLGALFWATGCLPAERIGSAGRPAGDPWRGFSLCAPDAARRPVWDALAAASGPPKVLPPGDHAVNHPALKYGQGWRVTPAGADPSANGDRLEFTFYGTDLALRVQGGDFWAYDRISVDGGPANALPRDETGAAYLALSDPLGEVRVVPVARGLPLGDHRVTLEATGGWDQWALQGLLVSISRPGWPPAVWLLLLGLSIVGWVVVAWPWRPRVARWLERAESWAGRWSPALVWSLTIGLGTLFLLSNGMAPSLVALLALGLLFLVRPELMLPLIAAGIPFWPHPKTLLHWQLGPAELLLWVGAIAMALRWIVLSGWNQAAEPASPEAGPTNRREDGRPARARGLRDAWRRFDERSGLRALDWPVLALLAVGLASTATALRLGVALRELRVVFFDGVLFYFLITRLIRPGSGLLGGSWARRAGGATAGRASPHGDYWPLIDGLVAGMVLVSAFGLWQLLTGQGRIDVEGVWRVRAFYGSPNNLALVLDRVVPLVVAVGLFSDTCRLRRWLYGLAAPVLVLACIATFSKGTLLLGLPVGIGLVAVAGAWRARQRWPVLALGAAALVSAAILFGLFKTQRFADLTNFQAGTSFIRLKLWQGAWHMALDHPWLGVGPDNFLYAYRTHYVLPSAWEELGLSHPHNIILDLWTRLGLAGIIVGGWALAAGVVRAWQLFRHGSRGTWPVALGLLGGLAATVSHGMIDNSLFLTDLMALFMLTMALLQVMTPVPTGEAEMSQLAEASQEIAAAGQPMDLGV